MGALHRLLHRRSAEERATDARLRETLTRSQFRVLRRGATEPAFSGEYVHTDEAGVYRCAACGSALFDSSTKFDSGTGWPSFTDPATPATVRRRTDRSLLIPRTEVTCAECGSHLGHVFGDGPGDCERYCINSAALSLDRAPEPADP